MLYGVATTGLYSDIEADADACLPVGTGLHLMPKPAWKQQQQPRAGVPQNTSTGVTRCRIAQRRQQHLCAGARVEKSNGAAAFRRSKVEDAAEQAIGMQMGPDRMSFPVHHRPGIVETGRCLVHVPTEVLKGLLAATGDPEEHLAELWIHEQIGLAVPSPLIGDPQTRAIQGLQVQNVLRPCLEIGSHVVATTPQWRAEQRRTMHRYRN